MSDDGVGYPIALIHGRLEPADEFDGEVFFDSPGGTSFPPTTPPVHP